MRTERSIRGMEQDEANTRHPLTVVRHSTLEIPLRNCSWIVCEVMECCQFQTK